MLKPGSTVECDLGRWAGGGRIDAAPPTPPDAVPKPAPLAAGRTAEPVGVELDEDKDKEAVAMAVEAEVVE